MITQHFIITRFNIPLPNHTRDKNGKRTLTDAWMEERFSLFERICMPSIMAQTNQDFQWVVLFDAQTKERWRAHIQALQTQCPRLTPIFTDRSSCVEAINELIEDRTEKVLTTRLDNDDALHREYVALVQRTAETKNADCFLLFRFGYSLQGDTAVVRSHRYNPFSTFVEFRNNASPIRTVYCSSHGHIRRVAPLYYIKERPFWLVGIHDRNAVNLHVGETRNYCVTDPKDVLKMIRDKYLRPLRRLFWPKAYRKSYTLAEIRKEFGIQPKSVA